ncbi:DUF262 domain-containing protein [Streptomyces solisilvae]|uniref:DUF262 domain-containing protein n=1 Tax=Streptomyces malaysiensis TaxID=92644 RepID=UPI0036B5F447
MGVDEIKSQGFSLKDLFRDVSYQVDYYQRDYTWGEEEVRTLLRDLCTSFAYWSNDPALIRRPGNAPQYFLGPFVYYEQSKNRRCLVDGQQRFVTLHLLFLQLRARVREHGDARRVDRLNRAITTDGAHFSIGISDHEPVLRAIDEGRVYETGLGDSLSRRNLWARSQQIETQLAEELDADKLDRFTDWLLDRVVLVGIRAANQDHGYRMFETMNDRGTRLTAVDLLKSHLLANVGTGEDQLNTRWQEMLRELATDREDPGAAARFIKATLLARYSRPDHAEDRRQIDANLNVWVRQNAKVPGAATRSPRELPGLRAEPAGDGTALQTSPRRGPRTEEGRRQAGGGVVQRAQRARRTDGRGPRRHPPHRPPIVVRAERGHDTHHPDPTEALPPPLRPHLEPRTTRLPHPGTRRRPAT